MRQRGNEVQKTHKGVVRYAHGLVTRGKHYAVLVVINIGRILHIPVLTAERQRDLAQILTCGSRYASGIADVLMAEKAGGIAALGRIQRGGDIAGVLFGL